MFSGDALFTVPAVIQEEDTLQSQDTNLEGMDLAATPSTNTNRNNRRPRPSRAERRSNSCPVQNMMFEIQIDTGMGRNRQSNLQPLEPLNEPSMNSQHSN